MNASETIVLVIVVPMLAPITIGMALSTVIEPAATKAITSEVVVELLWNRAVMRIPINNPLNGFDVANSIVSVKGPESLLDEWTNNVSAKRKSKSVAKR